MLKRIGDDARVGKNALQALLFSTLTAGCRGANVPPAVHGPLNAPSEFQVAPQHQENQLSVRLASNARGEHVAVWSSNHNQTYQVYAQRYAQRPDGQLQAQGDAFQVSQAPDFEHYVKAVSLDDQGRMNIVWASSRVDFQAQRLSFRSYDAENRALSAPLLVEELNGLRGILADAAGLPDGGLALSWSRHFGEDSDEIQVQIFDAQGQARTQALRVNQYHNKSQANPALAVDRQGRLTVVWESMGQDGSLTGIYGRRLDRQGTFLGPEFQVHESVLSFQVNADVASDAQGNFTVAWSSEHPVGHLSQRNHIFARRFSALGHAQGPEFQVSINSHNAQFPVVAMNALGESLMVWEDRDGGLTPEGDPLALDAGIYARPFGVYGQALGPQFPLNTFILGAQQNPAANFDLHGRSFVAWSSAGQDSSGLGIFARHLYPGFNLGT